MKISEVIGTNLLYLRTTTLTYPFEFFFVAEADVYLASHAVYYVFLCSFAGNIPGFETNKLFLRCQS